MKYKLTTPQTPWLAVCRLASWLVRLTTLIRLTAASFVSQISSLQC